MANYCLNLRKSKVNNLNFFQNCKTRLTRPLNTITVGTARAMEVEEMYLIENLETGQLYIIKNTGTMLR